MQDVADVVSDSTQHQPGRRGLGIRKRWVIITECCRTAKVTDVSLAPLSLHSSEALCFSVLVWWLQVQLQSLPSQHQWLPSKSSTVVMDEEKKRDYSSWQDHWLMFCFPYAQVSLLLEIAFSRLNSPSSNAFSVITGPLLGFCFSRGNFCIHSFIFLSFMSPVIVFCLLQQQADWSPVIVTKAIIHSWHSCLVLMSGSICHKLSTNSWFKEPLIYQQETAFFSWPQLLRRMITDTGWIWMQRWIWVCASPAHSG